MRVLLLPRIFLGNSAKKNKQISFGFRVGYFDEWKTFFLITTLVNANMITLVNAIMFTLVLCKHDDIVKRKQT